MRHVVGRVRDLPPGSVKILQIGNPQGIGVFNVRGRFYALKNVCPHQGGPLCAGPVTGTTEARFVDGEAPRAEWVRDGEIVRCPWHRWEFEIATGRTMFRSRLRVATYPVHVEGVDAQTADRLLKGVETYPVSVEDGVVTVEV